MTGKQAENIVAAGPIPADALLFSFPLPPPLHPEVILEVWRDQVRASVISDRS